MEESKAKGAENAYREVVRDRIKIAYGIVFVKDGRAVLKDVILDDIPIREYVKSGTQKP